MFSYVSHATAHTCVTAHALIIAHTHILMHAQPNSHPFSHILFLSPYSPGGTTADNFGK